MAASLPMTRPRRLAPNVGADAGRFPARRNTVRLRQLRLTSHGHIAEKARQAAEEAVGGRATLAAADAGLQFLRGGRPGRPRVLVVAHAGRADAGVRTVTAAQLRLWRR